MDSAPVPPVNVSSPLPPIKVVDPAAKPFTEIPSVCCPRFMVNPVAVPSTISIFAIWALPVSLKFAPIRSQSVFAPPSSRASFSEPIIESAPDPAVMFVPPLLKANMFTPSVWFPRLMVKPVAVASKFSIFASCASPVSLKFAPIWSQSVSAPPSSDTSFCAPRIVSFPAPAAMASAPVPPIIESAPDPAVMLVLPLA